MMQGNGRSDGKGKSGGCQRETRHGEKGTACAERKQRAQTSDTVEIVKIFRGQRGGGEAKIGEARAQAGEFAGALRAGGEMCGGGRAGDAEEGDIEIFAGEMLAVEGVHFFPRFREAGTLFVRRESSAR